MYISIDCVKKSFVVLFAFALVAFFIPPTGVRLVLVNGGNSGDFTGNPGIIETPPLGAVICSADRFGCVCRECSACDCVDCWAALRQLQPCSSFA